MTTTPAPQGASTPVDRYAGRCQSTTPTSSIPHSGDGRLHLVTLYTGHGKHRRPTIAVPVVMCTGHAYYEQRWRKVWNMCALAEVTDYVEPDPA